MIYQSWEVPQSLDEESSMKYSIMLDVACTSSLTENFPGPQIKEDQLTSALQYECW